VIAPFPLPGRSRPGRRHARIGAAVTLLMLVASVLAGSFRPAPGERSPFPLLVLDLLLGG